MNVIKTIGGGLSSVYQGIEKSITGKRINAGTYVADVGFGAFTGVFTGGAGAIGESVATNVAKVSAKIAIRAGTGLAVGVGAKAITEVKECATAEKKWQDFGKTLDSTGNVNVAGTVVSWASSGVVGAIGVGSSQIASELTQGVGTGIECVTRVVLSGTTAAASDAFIQGANIATGIQETFNVKQVFTSAAVSSVTTLGQEGVKQGYYAVNGGKDSYLTSKANNDMIEDNVPNENDQQSSKNGLEKVNKIDPQKLNEERAKVARNELSRQKIQASADIERPALMTDQNIHLLEGNLLGNIALDVSPPLDGPRNEKRLIINYDLNGKPKVIGYLPNHNYDDFSVKNGLEKHEFFMTVGDKVQNLVGMIETTQATKQEDEDEDQ